MKKLIYIFALVFTAQAFSQNVADYKRMKLSQAPDGSADTRIMTQNATSKELGWILKTDLAQDLQSVTDKGSETTNQITAFGFYVNGSSSERIVVDEVGTVVSWGDLQIRENDFETDGGHTTTILPNDEGNLFIFCPQIADGAPTNHFYWPLTVNGVEADDQGNINLGSLGGVSSITGTTDEVEVTDDGSGNYTIGLPDDVVSQTFKGKFIDLTGHQFVNSSGDANFGGTVAGSNLSGTNTGDNAVNSTSQPVDSDLTAIAALTTTTFGRSLLTQADAAATRSTIGAGTGSGTVTSVTGTGGVTVATGTSTPVIGVDGTIVKTVTLNTPGVIFSNPVNYSTSSNTATGTLSLNTQSANTVLAGPSSGGAASPTFRQLSTSEITEGSKLYFTNDRAIAATLTGYTSGAGTVGSSDSVLQAIQKLNGNIAANTATKKNIVEGIVATGTDTYTATYSPALTSYTDGLSVLVRFTNANTGAATLNLNSLGAKSIVKGVSSALVAGDIPAGTTLYLSYDGTNFVIVGSNMVNNPINWTPSFTGFSTPPTPAFAEYFLVGKMCTVHVQALAGTSSMSTFTMTLPFVCGAPSTMHFNIGFVQSNGAGNVGTANLTTGSNVLTIFNGSYGGFATSGSKGASFTITYPIP
jgi:hypothetical protein